MQSVEPSEMCTGCGTKAATRELDEQDQVCEGCYSERFDEEPTTSVPRPVAEPKNSECPSWDEAAATFYSPEGDALITKEGRLFVSGAGGGMYESNNNMAIFGRIVLSHYRELLG